MASSGLISPAGSAVLNRSRHSWRQCLGLLAGIQMNYTACVDMNAAAATVATSGPHLLAAKHFTKVFELASKQCQEWCHSAACLRMSGLPSGLPSETVNPP